MHVFLLTLTLGLQHPDTATFITRLGTDTIAVELFTFDGRVLVLKYVDPEVDGRYGMGIFVRCAPRA